MKSEDIYDMPKLPRHCFQQNVLPEYLDHKSAIYVHGDTHIGLEELVSTLLWCYGVFINYVLGERGIFVMYGS